MEAEFVSAACTSEQGMAAKTIIYIDNITAMYFNWKYLFFVKFNGKDTKTLLQPGCKVKPCSLNTLL